MTRRLRQRAGSESGFTLIELLVVMLILGILAAIAIPSFLNQKSKASDSDAKVQVRSAATAMETYATDNLGIYDGATPDKLRDIEPSLPPDPDLEVTPVPDCSFLTICYVVRVTSDIGNRYSLVKLIDGRLLRQCNVADTSNPGGCRLTNGNNGEW